MADPTESATNLRHRKMVPQASTPYVSDLHQGRTVLTLSEKSGPNDTFPAPDSGGGGGMDGDLYDGGTGGARSLREETTSLTEPLLGSSDSDIPHDDPVEPQPDVPVIKIPEEAGWQICLQIFFPYIIAGFGMVAAGMVLDVVQVSIIII